MFFLEHHQCWEIFYSKEAHYFGEFWRIPFLEELPPSLSLLIDAVPSASSGIALRELLMRDHVLLVYLFLLHEAHTRDGPKCPHWRMEVLPHCL